MQWKSTVRDRPYKSAADTAATTASNDGSASRGYRSSQATVCRYNVSSRGHRPPLQDSALPPSACRWNDTVHAQILDHLAVVIEAMSRGKGRQEETSSRGSIVPDDRLYEVRAVQGRDSFVAECKGIFHI